MSNDNGDQSNSLGEDHAKDVIFDFLQNGPYWDVATALVRHEYRVGELSVDHQAHLRDCLDHLMRAAISNISQDDLSDHIAAAHDHLRRAAVNSLQDEVEDVSRRIDRRLRVYFIWQEIYTDVIPEREALDRRQQMEELLAEARALKGNQKAIAECIRKMEEAHQAADELLRDMSPGGGSGRRLIVKAVLGILIALAAVLLLSLIGLVGTLY